MPPCSGCTNMLQDSAASSGRCGQSGDRPYLLRKVQRAVWVTYSLNSRRSKMLREGKGRRGPFDDCESVAPLKLKDLVRPKLAKTGRELRPRTAQLSQSRTG